MFRKILIANRGEIAVRIIRACRDLGIQSVAIFSDVDRPSLHVRYADEAYWVGPAPASESYLSIQRVLEVARRSGAEAVHPGYGFLSENPAFAEACEAHGLVFIGPSSETLRLTGSKTAARRLAARAGVPIVPGTDRDLSDEEIEKIAPTIGFPLVIKASAGGGGKGMRIVQTPHELPSAVRAARSEGQSSFGDPAIYLEKYISRPRHVEMQILADGKGKVLYLGERECSIQRRHQKVVEEAPSTFVDETLRRRLGEAAIRIAEACGYRNAGTVEFLIDQDRNFYFLEVNARLQVEHPVTEMVTGIDLVKKQILIAAGEGIPYEQQDITLWGHAIECRVYAEDPFHQFLPSPGRITVLRTPGGPGIRNDVGVFEGSEVSIYYDPIIAKLIAWGKDRQEAIQRMRRALREYMILGVQTTIPFHQRVMEDPRFVRGEIDTTYIDQMLEKEERKPDERYRDVALLAGALHLLFKEQKVAPPRAALREERQSLWKLAARQEMLRRR